MRMRIKYKLASTYIKACARASLYSGNQKKQIDMNYDVS